jgi:magnesium chelatase family protein
MLIRVATARLKQRERFIKMGMTHLRLNSQADGTLLEEIAQPDQLGLKLMRDAADAMGLSARGYHRVLRVARTLADLNGREQISRLHIAEALSYRQKLAAFQIAA